MKNLFNLSSLSIEEITAILDRAQQFADGEKSDRAKGKVVASLFLNQAQEPKILIPLRLCA